VLSLYKQKCQDQVVYICLTGIGQEICVVLFDDSDNENYEKDRMFTKSTIGIDATSSMILILFMNKGTDITNMQTVLKMVWVSVFSDDGKKFWYNICDVTHVKPLSKDYIVQKSTDTPHLYSGRTQLEFQSKLRTMLI